MEVFNVEELQKALITNKVVIYGANYVAIRFYRALKEQHLDKNVSCFVITSGEVQVVEGLAVQSIDKLEENSETLICIAVHEALKDEIIETLKEKGFHKYIWIYPFLYEMMLGEPIARNKRILLKNIWNINKDDYRMAARYLAIDQYFEKNNYGYQVYKKCMNLFNNEKTSEKRLQRFIKLIQNWENIGYDERQSVSLMEDYRYIDGAHRIALASYFKQEYIMCDIYPSSKSLSDVHGAGAVLSKEIAVELGVDEETIAILEETNIRIEEQYK